MGDYSTFAITMAFLLTLGAGLSTGIGSAIAFFTKRSNATFLSVALGFSAGVMIYLSFVEIFPKAQESLAQSMGDFSSYLWTTVAFFLGIFITMGIDRLVPDVANPHEARDVSEIQEKPTEEERKAHEIKTLKRMGLFTALAIGLHNFPEGLATFLSALEDPRLGISIAVAVAIHNIPEGIAVSVPIFYATGSRKKAFIYSFLSGMSEPVGALIGFFVLYSFLNDMTFGFVFAAVGGVMIYIALDELLPTAEKYGRHHLVIYGVISGMALMALSLVLFA
ncbi:MAG: zinc transporter ZupT [Candidatus Izemoplasmataceae bacterium]